MGILAAILAAGRGTRFGADKSNVLLRGKPLWKYSFDTFRAHPEISGVGLVCAEESVDSLRHLAPEAVFIVAGGATRQQSASIALAQAQGAEILLIHDGARPFATHELISEVLSAVRRSGAAAPAIQVTDTIREKGALEIIDRENLIAMQTPQGATIPLLNMAFAGTATEYTDEIALLRSAGIPAEIVNGEVTNFKITTPQDLARAHGVLGYPETRTGIGYDVHAFSKDPNRQLHLGGVFFEEGPGLEGHSDADVLLHAVVDGLLGAASLGDIGQHFPDTDPQWKDRSSIYFLEATKPLLVERGWRILNIDATVIAEFPKVMKKAEAIRIRISEALGLESHRVSIKATTNERLGSIGRGEGIAAFAVATLSESV